MHFHFSALAAYFLLLVAWFRFRLWKASLASPLVSHISTRRTHGIYCFRLWKAFLASPLVSHESHYQTCQVTIGSGFSLSEPMCVFKELLKLDQKVASST